MLGNPAVALYMLERLRTGELLGSRGWMPPKFQSGAQGEPLVLQYMLGGRRGWVLMSVGDGINASNKVDAFTTKAKAIVFLRLPQIQTTEPPTRRGLPPSFRKQPCIPDQRCAS